jgi:hypothetical protein
MSEANNVWRVQVDGREREIELEHSSLSGKRTVIVDGEVVDETRKWGFGKNQYAFDLDGHAARLTIDAKYGGLAYGSRLHVDRRYVEPLRR